MVDRGNQIPPIFNSNAALFACLLCLFSCGLLTLPPWSIQLHSTKGVARVAQLGGITKLSLPSQPPIKLQEHSLPMNAALTQTDTAKIEHLAPTIAVFIAPLAAFSAGLIFALRLFPRHQSSIRGVQTAAAIELVSDSDEDEDETPMEDAVCFIHVIKFIRGIHEMERTDSINQFGVANVEWFLFW